MSLSVLVIANDFSAVNVAIPTMEKDFSTNINTIQVKEPEVTDRRIDYPGIATISVGLVSLLIALDQVDDWGWSDPRVIAMLALAAVLIAAFVPIERRAGMSALVPRTVMKNESFRASCVAITLMSATFFASLLYLPQYMQKHLGYSPLEAGVGVLPFLATFGLVSFVAGPLYNRVGAKALVVLGAACITIAPFLFSQVGKSSTYSARSSTGSRPRSGLTPASPWPAF